MPIFAPYLTIVVILFVLYLGEQKKIKQLSVTSSRWIAYIILWIFIGFRGHIMSDFISYYPFFEEYPNLINLPNNFYIERFEPGFLIYIAVFKTFCSDYFIWIAFNTLIDLIVLAWFFHRYCTSMILPLIFFIAFNGLLIEFNLYRNVKAIDLFLLSIPYLQKRQLLPYILLNLIGVTFHTSALLYLPLYFFINKRMSNYIAWGGFIISNIIFLFHVSLIGNIVNNLSFMQAMDAYDKIMRYSSNGETYGISFGYLERTLTFVIFYSLQKKVVSNDNLKIIFYNCFWIYYCSTLIFYEVQVFVERIPYLFMFSYWVIYPFIIEAKYYYHKIINLFIGLLVVMKIIASYHTPASSYSNIIFGLPDYEIRKNIVEQELSQ